MDNPQHEEIGWNQTILNAVPGEEIGWDRTILAPQNLKSFNTADLVKNSDSRKVKDGRSKVILYKIVYCIKMTLAFNSMISFFNLFHLKCTMFSSKLSCKF